MRFKEMMARLEKKLRERHQQLLADEVKIVKREHELEKKKF